jgi:excisionase family DNA binding protein
VNKTGARRLVGVVAAAEYADVSPRTVRYWIAQGRLPGYRMGAKLVKVDLNDIDALAQQIPAAGGEQ